MEETEKVVETPISVEPKVPEPKIIQTDNGKENGQNKCPRCGATDVNLDIKSGKLKCNYCRFVFEPGKLDQLDIAIEKLDGQIIASGASNIKADSKDMLTLKCDSCGAEVVVDTTSGAGARCHWCRNQLSLNKQIPNGAVPDYVLPFAFEKEPAEEIIQKFVKKRRFYANTAFKKEFTTENIMGVYFPYMIVDANTHASFSGQGEHLVRRYTRGSGDNKKTYYDADLYDVEREFDLMIDNLTVESNSDRINNKASHKTNNVINAIMPFDIENVVAWDANFIKGFTSEKRDINIDELRPLVERQTKDVARFAANESLQFYDRGLKWHQENVTIKGQKWSSAYLPVWLYSYQQVKGQKKLLHYVAVNARTKEVMGSVPLNWPKLLFVSGVIEALGGWITVASEGDGWIALVGGVGYAGAIYAKYRNTKARHSHEKETTTKVSALRKVDVFKKHLKKLRNSRMSGANNDKVHGSTNSGENAINSILESNKTFKDTKDAINKIIK